MAGPGRGLRTLCLVVLVGAAASATLPGGSAAVSAGELDRRAAELRRENAALAANALSAEAGLVAIERRLAQARTELAAFRTRAGDVRDRRRAVVDELGVARKSLRRTQRALAARLQAVYEHGEADTLAVILGAGSLDDALNAMETIDLTATQDEDLIARTRKASSRLTKLNASLASRERELMQLAAAREAAAASLADARAQRIQTIAALRSSARANRATIADLQRRSRTLASASAAIPAPVAAVTPGAPRIPPASGTAVRSLTVVATAYALRGTTATGSTVGWGTVAVDPSVIPLGSRLSIPGYGLGVAADTGGAIHGAKIDLWFPTVAQARAWGNRVVTITIYPH